MPTEYDNTIQRLWWRATIGFDDMREAAEFEERVAAKLADIDFSPVADTRPWVRLKYARLEVEEEMDGKTSV